MINGDLISLLLHLRYSCVDDKTFYEIGIIAWEKASDIIIARGVMPAEPLSVALREPLIANVTVSHCFWTYPVTVLSGFALHVSSWHLPVLLSTSRAQNTFVYTSQNFSV